MKSRNLTPTERRVRRAKEKLEKALQEYKLALEALKKETEQAA